MLLDDMINPLMYNKALTLILWNVETVSLAVRPFVLLFDCFSVLLKSGIEIRN